MSHPILTESSYAHYVRGSVDGYAIEIVGTNLDNIPLSGVASDYVLISLMSPVRVCYPFQRGGVLSRGYVAEKLFSEGRTSGAVINVTTQMIADMLHAQPLI